MNIRWLNSLALLCLTTGALTVSVTGRLSAQTGPTPKPTTADLTKLPPLTSGAGDGDYAIGPQYTDAPRRPGICLERLQARPQIASEVRTN